jgi:hypothetical protein
MIVVCDSRAFGMPCTRCRNHLIAPVRSTYRQDRLVSNEWYCERCELTFVNTTCFEPATDSNSNVTVEPQKAVA